jgi:hypothetical protein
MKLLRFLCGEKNDNPVGNLFYVNQYVVGVLPLVPHKGYSRNSSFPGLLVLSWEKDSNYTKSALCFNVTNGRTYDFTLRSATKLLDYYKEALKIGE